MRQRGIIGFSGFSGDEEATVCPEGQYGVPPFCFEPSSWLPGGAEAGEATYGQCPEGTIGIPPNCVTIPQEVPPLPQLPPAAPTQCPAGQILDPSSGQCVLVQAPVQCPAGTLLDQATGQCVAQQQQIVPAPEKPSWWSQRSDAEKWLVVGVGVLGAVSLLALIKGAMNPGYSANVEAAADRYVVLYSVMEIVGKDEAGQPVHRLVHHEQTFPNEREAADFIGKLRSKGDARNITLRPPRKGLPGGRQRPYEVVWDDPSSGWRVSRESFASPEHAEKRAEYLRGKGYNVRVEERGEPAIAPWKGEELPVAGISRVKHRLAERMPFLVIYTTEKGPLSRSFETEAKAKQWALDFTDKKGYTTAVYAITREGKKLPLGYYKPNDGVPVAQDPVAAKAEADAKAAPATAVVPTVTPPPATATPNLLDTSRLSPTGIPLVRGKRLGHGSPPKKYRRMGARHPGDYAYPERFMFPLYFRDASGKLIVSKSRRHVANAKTRFSTYKHRYPMAIRQQIAGNINKAARRLGLEADVRP